MSSFGKKILLAISLFIMSSTSFADVITDNNTLQLGESLAVNEYRKSSNKQYQLYMQDDGNVTLKKLHPNKRKKTTIWESKTNMKNGKSMIFQADGNLVITNDQGSLVWESGTHNKGADKVQIQDSGTIVVMKGNEVIWSIDNPVSGSGSSGSSSG